MVIETARLLIRPFAADDELDALELFTDPEFMIRSLDGPMDAEGARAKLRTLIGLYQAHGFSKFALVEKFNRRLVGYCGLGLEPIEGPPVAEFGYRLRPQARGKGFATEASTAVLTDAFERLEMSFVQAIVEPDNGASKRVLEKLGMVYQRPVRFHGREWLLYRVERPA